MPSRASGPIATALALACALALGCGPRYARVLVEDREGVKAVLRAEIIEGQVVNRGYAHPATISGVRLAHILSRIDVRFNASDEGGGERKPAIATDFLYELGDMLSQALTKANSTQEIVIQALRKEKSLGIFTNKYYTSFVAYVMGDDFVIHLSKVDALLDKSKDTDKLREPVAGVEVMAFKVLPSDGMVPIGHQALAVDWRNPVFRSPTNIRIGPGGSVVRRTILMESADPAEVEPRASEWEVPHDPSVLRALADLEDARRNGAVTELEYQQQRRDLLRAAGEDEAGEVEELMILEAPGEESRAGAAEE
jgi:hypothetical protein